MHFQIHHRQQTSQMWNHLYSQDKQRPHLHLPRDSNTEELTVAGSRWAQRRFVTLVEAWSLMSQLKCYRIDVDTKVAGSETDMTAGIWQEDAGGPP